MLVRFSLTWLLHPTVASLQMRPKPASSTRKASSFFSLSSLIFFVCGKSTSSNSHPCLIFWFCFACFCVDPPIRRRLVLLNQHHQPAQPQHAAILLLIIFIHNVAILGALYLRRGRFAASNDPVYQRGGTTGRFWFGEHV